MSKYDFALRLKRIVQEECEIVYAETKISQKSAKYYDHVSSLKTMLGKQEKDLSECRKEIRNLKSENEKLEKRKQCEEDRLCVLLQKVEQMRDEYNQTEKKHVERRRSILMQMDCIRNLKLATQSFINLHALPELIQGVTISEKESTSEWKPFCIDPSKHTQKEVEDEIWHDSQNDSSLQKKWEMLVFGENFRNASQFVEMEAASGNVTIFP